MGAWAYSTNDGCICQLFSLSYVGLWIFIGALGWIDKTLTCITESVHCKPVVFIGQHQVCVCVCVCCD